MSTVSSITMRAQEPTTHPAPIAMWENQPGRLPREMLSIFRPPSPHLAPSSPPSCNMRRTRNTISAKQTSKFSLANPTGIREGSERASLFAVSPHHSTAMKVAIPSHTAMTVSLEHLSKHQIHQVSTLHLRLASTPPGELSDAHALVLYKNLKTKQPKTPQEPSHQMVTRSRDAQRVANRGLT